MSAASSSSDARTTGSRMPTTANGWPSIQHVDAVVERADREPSGGRRAEHDRRVVPRSPRRASAPRARSPRRRRRGRGRPPPPRCRSSARLGDPVVLADGRVDGARAAAEVDGRAPGRSWRPDSSGSVASSPSSPGPGATVSRLVPSASSWACRSARDDSDRPSTPTSAVMPIATPSADSAVRPLRTVSPRAPSRSRSAAPTAVRPASRRPRPVMRTARAGHVSCSTRPSRIDDHARQPARDLLVVRDHDDRRALVVQRVEELQDGRAGGLVEVAGRLVGQQDPRARARAPARRRPAGTRRPTARPACGRAGAPSPTRSSASRARRSRSGRRTPW